MIQYCSSSDTGSSQDQDDELLQMSKEELIEMVRSQATEITTIKYSLSHYRSQVNSLISKRDLFAEALSQIDTLAATASTVDTVSVKTTAHRCRYQC